MTMDYDHGRTAELYRKAKAQPWRSRIESHSFMKRIGDLAGKDVLDVACGEGHYTRKLRQAGAARVVGVDVSARMIELARAQEGAEPLGVEYRVEDARAIARARDRRRQGITARPIP
jgi:2-polyprenyl-3-methyl-5-hydroxy-6-metoxy-1,4-benzoquinol methylase